MLIDIAEVYVLDVPYQIDRPYSYYVPGSLRDAVVPGALVEVPFGNGNRHQTGIVYKLAETADSEDIKPVMSAAGVSSPLLDGEAMRMCMFLKEHTLCTFGDAVRTIVPAAALSRIADSYSAAEGSEDALDGLSPVALEMYDALKRRPLDRGTLTAKFGSESSGAIVELVKAKLIVKNQSMKSGDNIRYSVFISPTEACFENGVTVTPKLKSEKQKAVYYAVAENPGIELTVLSGKVGLEKSVARTAVDALEKKGYFVTEKVQRYRNPFADTEAPTQYKGDFTLSEEQSRAYEMLSELYLEATPRAALLHGVTGSGKTNVILKLIDKAVKDGRGVIMLVPEIALTPQTVSRFVALFGSDIAVIHSSLSAGERFDAWQRIRQGEVKVVIGTRSAVFAPVKNLGLIVIDEEHEHTYKSDTDPKYSAHDVAAYRVGQSGGLMILASATPSVVSYHKATTGKYTLVELKERYGGASLPEVEVCDMRAELASGNPSPLSRALVSRITEDLRGGRQTILFLNRRGYNSYVSCRSCGEAIKCPNCSVTMTYHLKSGGSIRPTPEKGEYLSTRRSNGFLYCHTCGHREEVPETCPECSSEHLMFMGAGTQLAEGELEKLFPGVRVARMDHDTTRGKQSHEALLSAFREGSADILLGTQMVTKGHDFPGVTTVGILNADSAMFLDDYRASERTFSMLTQVIGRAGRADEKGVSVIQTFSPNSDIIALAAAQDYPAFFASEIRIRKARVFPPFCDIALLTLSSMDEVLLAEGTKRLGELIRHKMDGDFNDVKIMVFGPFEAPVYRVQNVCRLRYVIKCKLTKRTREMFSVLLTEFSLKTSRKNGRQALRLAVDFNPTNI